MLPQREVLATGRREFDPSQHTDLELLVLLGYAPAGALVGQYKLYNISRLDMTGLVLRASVVIEIPPGHGHEQAWFDAYVGQRVAFVEPDSGSAPPRHTMKIVASSFDKKVIAASDGQHERRIYEARLDMKELWRSAFSRQKSNLVKTAVIALKWATITALGAAIVFVVQQLLLNG